MLKFAQNKVELSTGFPEHMFTFPSRGKITGIMLSKDQFTEVAEVPGVTDADGDAFDFMNPIKSST